MVSLIFCPLPQPFVKVMEGAAEEAVAINNENSLFFKSSDPAFVRLTLQFNFNDSHDSFFHHIRLWPTVVPQQPAKSEMAMCLAPMFRFDEKAADASIQWREHHRLLGVNTVYVVFE